MSMADFAVASQALRQTLWRLDCSVEALDGELRDRANALRREVERLHSDVQKLEAMQDAQRSR
jgi:uncharacterized small protein (DUF1192 family)